MKKQTLALIRVDLLRAEYLHVRHEIVLPQAMIWARFIRNLIWDSVQKTGQIIRNQR